MPWGAIIGAVGSLAGGAIQAGSAQSAANTQASALNQASAIQQGEFNTIQGQLAPFYNTGVNAGSPLAQFYGVTPSGFDANAPFLQPISYRVGAPPSPDDASLRTNFQASPGYQYQLQQSSDAIQNSAAGKTGAVSGNMMKALQTNATGLAGQDWWNYYQQLVNNYGQRYADEQLRRTNATQVWGGLAGAGQNAAAQMGGFGTTAATNIGSNIATAGSAQAAGQIGAGNAFSNAFNSPNFQNGVNSGVNYLLANQQQPAGGYNYSPYQDYSGGGGY